MMVNRMILFKLSILLFISTAESLRIIPRRTEENRVVSEEDYDREDRPESVKLAPSTEPAKPPISYEIASTETPPYSSFTPTISPTTTPSQEETTTEQLAFVASVTKFPSTSPTALPSSTATTSRPSVTRFVTSFPTFMLPPPTSVPSEAMQTFMPTQEATEPPTTVEPLVASLQENNAPTSALTTTMTPTYLQTLLDQEEATKIPSRSPTALPSSTAITSRPTIARFITSFPSFMVPTAVPSEAMQTFIPTQEATEPPTAVEPLVASLKENTALPSPTTTTSRPTIARFITSFPTFMVPPPTAVPSEAMQTFMPTQEATEPPTTVEPLVASLKENHVPEYVPTITMSPQYPQALRDREDSTYLLASEGKSIESWAKNREKIEKEAKDSASTLAITVTPEDTTTTPLSKPSDIFFPLGAPDQLTRVPTAHTWSDGSKHEEHDIRPYQVDQVKTTSDKENKQFSARLIFGVVTGSIITLAAGLVFLRQWLYGRKVTKQNRSKTSPGTFNPENVEEREPRKIYKPPPINEIVCEDMDTVSRDPSWNWEMFAYVPDTII